LLLSLDRYETHVGPGNRPTDNLDIGHIVPISLGLRLDELRCPQLPGVPNLPQLASPVVYAATRFHANHVRLELYEKRQHFDTPELLA
jgi:hypothetical protein